MSGLAYQCNYCSKAYVNTKGRMKTHVYKYHLPLERSPYYCGLCLFRCESQRELQRHRIGYPLHRQRVSDYSTTDPQFSDEKYLHSSEAPHILGEKDFKCLNVPYQPKKKTVTSSLPVVSSEQEDASLHYFDIVKWLEEQPPFNPTEKPHSQSKEDTKDNSPSLPQEENPPQNIDHFELDLDESNSAIDSSPSSPTSSSTTEASSGGNDTIIKELAEFTKILTENTNIIKNLEKKINKLEDTVYRQSRYIRDLETRRHPRDRSRSPLHTRSHR